MASTKQWCDRHGEDFDDWWRHDDVEIHHFIGKDITYFHTLFWPGMLRSAGFSLPTKVRIHGFLTVGGEKMSKSKGTFVNAATYLQHLDPVYLRYYYASKLGARLDDIDLNLDEFAAKANADLVGKVVTWPAVRRISCMPRVCPRHTRTTALFQRAAEAGDEIAAAYEAGDYGRAMRLIMELADRESVRRVGGALEAGEGPAAEKRVAGCVHGRGMNFVRQLAVYLAPVLPRLAHQTGELLGPPIQRWDESKTPLTGTPVAEFQHMLKRVEKEDVDKMIRRKQAADC